MALSTQTLTQLEACGVTQAHLEALLRFFRCQENGAFKWHAHQGRLARCEYHVICCAKPATVHRVGESLCGGAQEE